MAQGDLETFDELLAPATPGCTSWEWGVQNKDAAYLWQAPAAGRYTIDTIGSDSPSALYVRDTICTGEELACNAIAYGSTRNARVTLELEQGQQLVLVVDSLRSSGARHFVLNIDRSERGLCESGEDEDGDGLTDCDDPDCHQHRSCLLACADGDLGSATGEDLVSASNEGAGNDWSGSCGGEWGADMAYLWTAPTARSYRFTSRGTRFNSVMYVLASCDGTELYCNETAGWLGDDAAVFAGLDAGESVLLVIDNESSYGDGQFSIHNE